MRVSSGIVGLPWRSMSSIAGTRLDELRAIDAVGNTDALVGVNDRAQLREAEELLYERIRGRLGREGVMVRGDARMLAALRGEAPR